MSGRPHLSIGDVLSLLRQEFSDVTISKIRFLESQGLIDPERSASGYRKFYEEDVERLRWVLRKQRDQFLPLKVIRDRLAAAGDGVPPDDEPPAPVSEPEVLESTSPEIARRAPVSSAANGMSATTATREVLRTPDVVPREVVERAPAHAAGHDRGDVGRRERDTGPEPHANPAGRSASAVSMTMEELCAATGLDDESITALESVGLISSVTLGGGRFYDDEAVAVCKLAEEFGRFGIEARHLRVFRNASEREVDLIEQVVTPLLRQRNPESHARALETAQELARLGQSLRASLVRSALHRQLGA